MGLSCVRTGTVRILICHSRTDVSILFDVVIETKMMNNRIKEIAEQASVDPGQLFADMLCSDSEASSQIADAWNSQPKELRNRIFNLVEQNQQKFAELLILECLDIVDVVCNSSDNPKRLILERFGMDQFN